MDEHEISTSFLLAKEEVSRICATPSGKGKTVLGILKDGAISEHTVFNVIELSHHASKVEVHNDLNDLWYCIEGEVKFLCGGTMQEPHIRVRRDGTEDPTELRAKALEGSKEIMVKSGDWLWIPAGEPHQHITEEVARLMIIKIPRH